MNVFVDTAFWAAFANARDDRNAEARMLMRAHASASLVTTNHVRGETWTLLRARSGHRSAVEFIDGLGSSARVRLVFVSAELEESAVQWLRRHDELPYSFVDATSFAVMRSLRIKNALTFDEDFAAAGFAIARPS
jgi:predicted nucleic acid-binding protein